MTTQLFIVKEKLSLEGNDFEVFSIKQADASQGFHGNKGDVFQAQVINQSDEPTAIHWHGLLLPNDQDGVPCLTQDLIMPEQSYAYNFPLTQAGTYWMHSHYRDQECKLLAAPLIIANPDADENFDQEIIMFLQEIGTADNHYLLTNRRLLNDIKNQYVISSNSSIRLRIINAATDANFIIDLGELKGQLIAVDGEDVIPVIASQFQIGISQRLDIRLDISADIASYPILAKACDSQKQTGLILTMPYSDIAKVSDQSASVAASVDYTLEESLQGKNPLIEKPIDRELRCYMGFDVKTHAWLINGNKWPDVRALKVKEGERVLLIFKNQTYRQHPMHLHGHVFQVIDIDGKKINGACRDTVVVLPKSTVKVIFDANHPGKWMIHCHMTSHKELGMMAALEYE